MTILIVDEKNLDSPSASSYRRASVGGIPQSRKFQFVMSPTEAVMQPQMRPISPRDAEVSRRLQVLRSALKSLNQAPACARFELLTEACRASRHFRMHLYWACCESGQFSTPVVAIAIQDLKRLVELAGMVAKFERDQAKLQAGTDTETQHKKNAELAKHYQKNLNERLESLQELYRHGITVPSIAPPRRKVDSSRKFVTSIEPARILLSYACHMFARTLERPILTELAHEAGPYKPSVDDHLEHIQIVLAMIRGLTATAENFLTRKNANRTLHVTLNSLRECAESIEVTTDELSKIARSSTADKVEELLRSFWMKTLVPEFTAATEALYDTWGRVADPFPSLRSTLVQVPMEEALWLAEVQDRILNRQLHNLPWSPGTTVALKGRYAAILGETATTDESCVDVEQLLFQLAYSSCFWQNERVEKESFLQGSKFSRPGFKRFCDLLQLPANSKSAKLAAVVAADIRSILLLGDLHFEFGKLKLKTSRRKSTEKVAHWQVEVVANPDYFMDRFKDDELEVGQKE